MQRDYQKNQWKSTIFYGETFVSTLPSLDYQNKHIILITNQRYYDLFSEKLNQLLNNEQWIDWYICTNQTHCNTLDEMNQLLRFISRFSHQREYLILAFGNEGVVDLAGFVQKHMLLKSELWILPVSIRSLAKALLEKAVIFSKQEQPILATNNLSRFIIYDQTLTQDQKVGKMIDLLIFIICGIVNDRNFLSELYFNYPTPKTLQTVPFTGMIESVIRFYESNGEVIDGYGAVFERAFYQAEGGHLFSSSMKRMLGILFQLKWNIEVAQLSFNYEKFLTWLSYLGYPLALPREFLVSDYAEKVMQVLEKSEALLYLEDIGKAAGKRLPTSEELWQAVTNYQIIVEGLGDHKDDI